VDINTFFELDSTGRTRGHCLKLKKGLLTCGNISSVKESLTSGIGWNHLLLSLNHWTS